MSIRIIAALSLGRHLSERIWFTCADGEHLPLAGGSFDQIVCRVALPYMHIPNALLEMARVLKPGGNLWLALHPPMMVLKGLLRDVSRFKLKAATSQLCVLANGLVWHVSGRQIRFPFCRYPRQSFQTVNRMEKALSLAGFENIQVQLDRFFVMTAQKRRRSRAGTSPHRPPVRGSPVNESNRSQPSLRHHVV